MKATLAAIAAAACLIAATPAAATVTCSQHGCSDWAGSPQHAPKSSKYRASRSKSAGSSSQQGPSYVVRQTALGPIEVAPGFADKAAAVANELAAAGHKVRIKCRSFGASHVENSLHFRSRACDVCQSGWGRTCVPRSLLTWIVSKHGLRDGCEFRDWGHFDDGPHLLRARVIKNCGLAYADAVDGRRHLAGTGKAPPAPFYGPTSDWQEQREAGR